jgi:TolB-like protein
MDTTPTVGAFAFEDFILDLRRGSLRTTAGQDIPLRRQSFELLRLLLENAGRLLDRDTINRVIWSDIAVTDDSITQCVRDIRRAIGDDAQRILKTVPRRGYVLAADVTANRDPSIVREGPGLALPDRPSLVVLPFQNMSADPEQEYFVDGLVEDITTALACIPSLFIIARNSAFTYKGRAVDVRDVGRDLGVRYVLEGSVRRAGNRVRITGQLVDAITAAHLWGDRFDGALDDVFDLQARVAESVAGAIEPRLQRAEIERVRRKATQDLGAYDYYLRGLASMHEGSGEAIRAAHGLFSRATELDPSYGAAYGLAAFCVGGMRASGLLPASAPESAEGVRLAWLAAQTGRDDPIALCYGALALSVVGMNPHAGVSVIDRGVAEEAEPAVAGRTTLMRAGTGRRRLRISSQPRQKWQPIEPPETLQFEQPWQQQTLDHGMITPNERRGHVTRVPTGRPPACSPAPTGVR